MPRMPQAKGLTHQQIRDRALGIIAESPGGIRYSKLLDRINGESPETPRNSIAGSIWNLDQLLPEKVHKPERGLFALLTPNGQSAEPLSPPGQAKAKEEEFYLPLAEWLKEEGEVTAARPLGGAPLKEKWGSPDVVGVYRALPNHLVKFPLEIIAAEVKVDPQASVVAFGQAVAYRLFATKSLIAMPRSIGAADESRLEALCMLFGVGLVLFDPDATNPAFSISVRASRSQPDMFYVNEFAKRLNEHDSQFFNSLFG